MPKSKRTITYLKENRLGRAGGRLFNLNKKGISEVITTLVLTVITISAVALAGYSLLEVFKTSANIQASPEYNCLDLQLDASPVVEITKACYNQETKDIELTVKRSAVKDIYIDNLKFTLHSTIPESAWSCSSSSCSDCIIPEKGQAKTYFFSQENGAGGGAAGGGQNIKTAKVYVSDCELDERAITQFC